MITVLMATYQGKQYLEQQLDSILAQTVPVRIMVSDDGSDDGTREMLEDYRRWYPRQIVLRHRVAGERCHDGSGAAAGPGKDGKAAGRAGAVAPAARNFFYLLAQAKAEGISDYVMFSDQDDVWFNHKVKRLMTRMKRLERELGKQHPILVHSDMEVVDRQLGQLAPGFFKYQHMNPGRTGLSEILVENPVTGGALLMNRAMLELAAPMPEFCWMHDWWIALTASCFGTISWVREPLYQYRQHGTNTLGAKATGSAGDLRERMARGGQVAENYRRMMWQARAFLRQYGSRLEEGQKRTLHAYLKLPYLSPAARLASVRRYHFYKSSRIQTIAMCVAMPRVRAGKNAGGRPDNRRERL